MDTNELHLEIEEMQKHRWIESQKKGFDLGVTAYDDWVEKYADAWRLIYNYISQSKEDWKIIDTAINEDTKNLSESEKLIWLKQNLHSWLVKRLNENISKKDQNSTT